MPFNSFNLSGLFKALSFAAERHRSQTRKDAEASPYINHPIQLCEVLTSEAGVDDPVVLMAALLHDTLEDTETSYQDLVEAFGSQVADVVLEVTDDANLPKEERKRRQVELAPQLSARAKLVKLADKICNVRDIAEHPPHWWAMDRRIDYCEWAKTVVDGLRGSNAQLEALFDAAYANRPRQVHKSAA
jgi:guanosine-3',5'-bis(diphosphate) 3'-pyrophosphohydrolase